MATGQKCQVTPPKSECDQALDAADTVINKQGELILLLSKQKATLVDENDKLSEALVEMKSINGNELQRNITYGLAGVIVGVALMAYIKK